jgi:hypothetical protein
VKPNVETLRQVLDRCNHEGLNPFLAEFAFHSEKQLEMIDLVATSSNCSGTGK